MKREISVIEDEITKEISNNFDFDFNGSIVTEIKELPSNHDRMEYGIGLIVGRSGSGKTSILGTLGEFKPINWEPTKAICSHFSSVEDAQNRLGSVGLNSIPTWMKPFHVLSNGEAFRANLARSLENGALIDEFTSVVDRNVAKSCSKSIRKYVDRVGLKGLVFSSCHYDIIDWLQPDWIFDASTGEFEIRGSERRFPEIKIELLPCHWKEWESFKEHHYLSGEINKSSWCWIATWDKVPIGFASALAHPSGYVKNAWRGHRTVVLPEYQGLGIGVRISDAVASLMVSEGYRYFSKTSHVRMGEYRERSPNWKATSKNKKKRLDYNTGNDKKHSKELKEKHMNRLCFSHEYVDANIKPKEVNTLDFLFV